MRVGLVESAKPNLQVRIVAREQASAAMLQAVESIETQFKIRFETLAVFPQQTLKSLHGPDGIGEPHPGIRVVSEQSPDVARLVGELTRLANMRRLTDAERQEYLRTLLAIYDRIGVDPNGDASKPDTLVLGIEREGRILAEKIGILQPGTGVRPQIKRVHFEGGLVVGVGVIGVTQGFSRCIVIDGAIASGATQIALMEHLRSRIRHFSVYSAHATLEGLRAISRYAQAVDIDLSLVVGHSTSGLNDHFYAVCSGDPERLVVGDLGDTISPIA